jgi:flagellar assembly protein FliH
MPSCDATSFVPLGGTPSGDAFRPLGGPAPAAAPPEPAPPDPDPREAAFAAGRAQGRADAAAEHARLTRELVTTLAAVGAWRSELRTRYTPVLVALAVAIARKIVGTELDARPEQWVPIVADAMRRLVDREQVTVRASPRVAAVLRAHASALGDPDAIRIVEDAALGDEACRVEGRGGDVDCSLAAQLAAVADALGIGPA